jgi:hypothetical protein
MKEKIIKPGPLSLEQKRLRAIEYAFWGGRLLDPRYFDQASKAIADKNKEEFLKIAKDAGIPQDVLDKFKEDLRPLNLGSGWGWGGW